MVDYDQPGTVFIKYSSLLIVLSLSLYVYVLFYGVYNIGTFPFTNYVVLEKQATVGLYCILTGSCSSQTKQISSVWINFNQHVLSNNISIMSSGVSYSPVIYHD